LWHLRQGEQLAWYKDGQLPIEAGVGEQLAQPVEHLVARLPNEDEAVTPEQLIHSRSADLDLPGCIRGASIRTVPATFPADSDSTSRRASSTTGKPGPLDGQVAEGRIGESKR
jgi:hypothetical protein